MKEWEKPQLSVLGTQSTEGNSKKLITPDSNFSSTEYEDQTNYNAGQPNPS